MATETPFLAIFEPQHLLGRGGMGEVWEVRHRSSGQPFAVKFARERATSGERDRLAFEREVRAQARLHHPRVLPVLAFGELTEPLPDLGQPVGTRWCAFECVRGGSLSTSIIEPFRLRVVLLRILDALAHCHAVGLAHLDLKPENLLWRADPTDVVLADFGIAQLMGRQDKVSGTPSYMAPEQWLGGELDARTDLYALGCLAYRLAVGMPPFLGAPIRVREAHCRHPLPPTDEPAFDAWIARLCEKDPSRRFQSAAMAAAALPARLFVEPGTPDHVGATEPELTALQVDASTPLRTTPAASGTLPLPPSWRTPRMGLHSIGTLGLGGLGVRDVPLLGREALQDALWAEARAVADGAGARAVTLVGTAGSGRSRLLAWLRVRLRELDAAIVLEGAHGHGPDLPFAVRLLDDVDPAQFAAIASEVEQHRAAGARVLVVAVCDQPPAHGRILEVPPLRTDAALALASAWVALSPTTAAGLVQRSGGMPGAMAWELEARMAAGSLEHRPDGLGFVGPAPDPHAPLTPEEATVCAAVAVLPLPTVRRVIAIARLAGLQDPTGPLWTLVRRGMLREQGDTLHKTLRCPGLPELRAVREAARDTSTSPFERIVHEAFLGSDWAPLAAALADPEVHMSGLATSLAERATILFTQNGLPAEHLAWADHLAVRASIARFQGDLDAIRAAVEQLRTGPAAWSRPLGRALTVQADALARKGHLDEAWRATTEADACLATAGTSRERTLLQIAKALITLNRFDWDGTEAVLQAAERLPGATEDDLRRVVPWRRTLLASRGHPREALEQTLASLRENPGFHGLWCAVPTLYWELREPELAVATVAETVAVPATIRRVVRTMACLSSIALERYDEADAATLAPDPGFTESARRHIRLVCAAPHVEMPFDLLLLACSIEQPPRYDDVWETWLLRTAAWRARRAGSIDRAERAEQAADRRAARLPIDLQQRIPPPGPFR